MTAGYGMCRASKEHGDIGPCLSQRAKMALDRIEA
jgi:hypothetical protein